MERIQIHKGKERIDLFSRRLEKITEHYPDVSQAIQKLVKVNEIILEGEVVAINAQTDEFLPFQELMHRRRKYGIKEAVEDYPVVINLFDILYFNGEDKTSLTYVQRRHLIEKITRGLKNQKVKLVPQCIVKKINDIESQL